MGWNYLSIPKLQRLHRWSLGKDKQFHSTLYYGYNYLSMAGLTHWGRVTHICVGNLTIIGSDNGLSPGRRQAIIWTNAWILLIGPSATNFSEILIEILTFSFKKMRLKVSSGKWGPFCLGLNVSSHTLLVKGEPGLQQLWYWQYKLGSSLTSVKNDFNYLSHNKEWRNYKNTNVYLHFFKPT